MFSAYPPHPVDCHICFWQLTLSSGGLELCLECTDNLSFPTQNIARQKCYPTSFSHRIVQDTEYHHTCAHLMHDKCTPASGWLSYSVSGGRLVLFEVVQYIWLIQVDTDLFWGVVSCAIYCQTHLGADFDGMPIAMHPMQIASRTMYDYTTAETNIVVSFPYSYEETSRDNDGMLRRCTSLGDGLQRK